MAKIEKLEDDGKLAYIFYCPGCKFHHAFYVSGYRISWEFNGDIDNPSFSPSLRNRDREGRTCHLFVKNGKIEYCNDCFHELKGQTVEMELVE
jgi:hypothetical protein